LNVGMIGSWSSLANLEVYQNQGVVSPGIWNI
jgi:hypothetical protein